MRMIHCEDCPPPHGHYSHAVIHRDVVYVSGVLGNAGPDGRAAGRDAQAQIDYCLEQIARILAAVGSGLGQVLKLNVHVRDLSLWPVANAACARAFGAHRPARIIAPAGELRCDSLVEMDAIAALREEAGRTDIVAS